MDDNNELEGTKCCGTTCDKQKLVTQFASMAQTIAVLSMHLKLMRDATDKLEVPMPMLASDAEMLVFIKQNMRMAKIEHSLTDKVLLGYVQAFREQWTNINFSS